MEEIFDFLEQHSELVNDADLDGLIREFEKTKFKNRESISFLIALLIEADIPEFREKMFLNYDQATDTIVVSFHEQLFIELISAKGWMSSSSAYDTNHFILHVLEKENKDQIGVVTGLAYTQFGGDILPIEVNYFAGKGGLILTGKLGEVMKESASIAFDFVKANAEKLNIDKCVNCGLCSYICPARIDLRQIVKDSKEIMKGEE